MESIEKIKAHIQSHLAVAAELEQSAAVIAQSAAVLIKALAAGRRVYVLGNGGSAADAQHIAAELIGRFKAKGRRALPAVALTTDTSNLTAIGNDFGFDAVFKRQVEALVQPGDVVWALSVSGQSPNVIAAVEEAKRRGARIIGFTGQQGAALKALCEVCLMSAHTESDRVQEVHQLAYHIICGIIDEHYSKNCE
ncbi:MAG: Phosphoheptose isomerase [Phycisphaerae bacterium]|nr:Phosphoheptose isomerase [Phycisphaerae bacterium]